MSAFGREQPATTPESEPNDGAFFANPAANGSRMAGCLNPDWGDPEDWYSIDLVAGDTLDLSFFGECGVDTIVFVYLGDPGFPPSSCDPAAPSPAVACSEMRSARSAAHECGLEMPRDLGERSVRTFGEPAPRDVVEPGPPLRGQPRVPVRIGARAPQSPHG